MGTREGVEKLPYGVDHSPATKKQDDLIASIVKKYPVSSEYPEYFEYQQKKEKASATEFIDAFVERNSDRIGNFRKLVSYIAERPSVEKLGRHGLFSQTDDKIDLDAVAEKVASHQGILWTHVISLRREDAERLGYNNAEAWKKAIRRNMISIAEAHKIKVSDLKWYAAFHNTTHHPHVHLLVFSRDPRTGYLTNKGIESMRSVFARDLFRNEQYKPFQMETQQRDLLKQKVNKLLDNMDISREASPELVALFQTLVTQLDGYRGKRVYGYLPKPIKETVNKIVDELAKEPTVSEMYDVWCKINRAKLSVYSEKEKPPVPLSENDVFRSIKNTILQKSVYLMQLSHLEGLTKENFQHSCGTKQEVNKKIKDYIAAFEDANSASHESKKRLQESMQNWLELFKFPAVERSTYDRLECTAKHQIYPVLGDKVVGDITSADIRGLLNQEMNDGYAYTTVKKVHVLLNEYFRYLTQQELIVKNPMVSTPMIKKSNFLAAQDKENLPEYDRVTVFTPEEIKRFKSEAFRCYSNGNRVYQQAAAYILMLNTGLRTGELLGLLNSDIDLEHRVMHLNRGVKEVAKRDGVTAEHGREVKTGKLKSASRKRDVPLNDTAMAMIQDLRTERYMGEDTPLVCDENGDFTRPVNFRKRYYRVLQAAGIPTKGLHSLRHTYATVLVNGIRHPDGSIKALTPRQVADLLGHTTSQITEMYYVKKDTARLSGITDDFNI